MSRIGFVGNGSDKFTELGAQRAKEFISDTLWMAESVDGVDAMVSGHSPVGGVDIWAEEAASEQFIPLDLKIPTINQWNPPGGYGFKARNLDIAKDSDTLYVVLASTYPEEYKGRRFDVCYHCARRSLGGQSIPPHVKSGGCWTGWKAVDLGKDVVWWIIENY